MTVVFKHNTLDTQCIRAITLSLAIEKLENRCIQLPLAQDGTPEYKNYWISNIFENDYIKHKEIVTPDLKISLRGIV